MGWASSGSKARAAGSTPWLNALWFVGMDVALPRAPVTAGHSCGGTSRSGTRRAGWEAREPAGQPSSASCHAVPHHVEPCCLALPAQTGSGRALPNCRGCFGCRGCSSQAVPRGPDLAPQCCHWEPGGGRRLATLPAAACAWQWLLGSAAVWGLRFMGGRSWRAAPLEALDVPPAGLSGRSRSCPNRSPGSQHGIPQLPGLGQLCGVQGPLLPLCCLHWAVPAAGSIILVLRLRTPHGRMPWGGQHPSLYAAAGEPGRVLGQGPAEPPGTGEMLPHPVIAGACGATGEGERSRVQAHSTAGTTAPQALRVACTKWGLAGAPGPSQQGSGSRQGVGEGRGIPGAWGVKGEGVDSVSQPDVSR